MPNPVILVPDATKALHALDKSTAEPQPAFAALIQIGPDTDEGNAAASVISFTRSGGHPGAGAR
jgi:hypothetical protein